MKKKRRTAQLNRQKWDCSDENMLPILPKVGSYRGKALRRFMVCFTAKNLTDWKAKNYLLGAAEENDKRFFIDLGKALLGKLKPMPLSDRLDFDIAGILESHPCVSEKEILSRLEILNPEYKKLMLEPSVSERADYYAAPPLRATHISGLSGSGKRTRRNSIRHIFCYTFNG